MNLSRALRSPNTRPATARRILRALNASVALVARVAPTLRCALCHRDVVPGGHPCVAEDGSGRPEEHLAECACGVFHEPHCSPLTAPAPRP